ncbi:hypothetical protein ACFQ7J_33805 [Streptomyces sp. NPDC056501]|uniref:hypothetical protein n=1 Tax=Streptomyces sp. NPDC056501 TaxID=3345841 RepID=UPI003691DED7
MKMHMQRSAAIVRTGNPYGVPTQASAFPTVEAQRLIHLPYDIPKPATEAERKSGKPRLGRVYVTYTKKHTSGRVYSGRTSAVIDLNKPWRPQAEAAMKARNANHHADEREEPEGEGFGPAQLDEFAVGKATNYGERYRDLGYLAIRGREQQLIDHHGMQEAARLGIKNFRGGAWSDTGSGPKLTENDKRGVDKDSIMGELFHNAAVLEFGEYAPFTGTPFNNLAKNFAGLR